jgi:hypothetical protein
MIRLAHLAFLSLAFLLACTHRTPIATVELIDTSLSIAPQAEKSALDAVRGQILRMDRGDSLVLIPITGNAENDAGGRILRLQAPTKRESYDVDLRRFRDSAQKQFAAWEGALGAERCRTDILGSLDAARQELAAIPKGDARRLIVVSDFLEDDGQYHFATDRALSNLKSARGLASALRGSHSFAGTRTQFCLGRLESADFEGLSLSRKQAIRVFWLTYFAEAGSASDIQLDGLSLLTQSESVCPAQATSRSLGGRQ